MIEDGNARVFVAGHRGLVGSAIVRALQELAGEVVVRSRSDLDLLDRAAVDRFFNQVRPTHVFLAAAKVGGIAANSEAPADFLFQNLAIQNHVIDAAFRHGTKKLLFLGSSCIYPKLAPQPIKEEYLLTGPLEPTNEWYAVAKIAGIKLCQAYRRQHGFDAISLMPTNLYGPGDNFDLRTSHVLPALIRKFHEGKERGENEVVLWGTGTPRREFLHVDDLARAAVHLMETYSDEAIVNAGWGKDISIAELAELVKKIVGYEGAIAWDRDKPDGTPRKLLDCTRIFATGWKPTIALEQGIADTFRWYATR